MTTGVRGGTETLAAVQRAPRGAFRLSAVAGPGAGRSLAVTKSMLTVGRHPTNDLVITDPLVSGVHLEMQRLPDRLHVKDAGSTNGTWLGGHKVTELELAPGAELRVGQTLLRLELDPEAHAPPAAAVDSFGQLVGRSEAMRETFATLERVAAKPLSVLLQGETGTGKEEAARAIHTRSARAQAPFVVIDATSLPETLVESLLFGHEKGAFTGADQRRIGLFEAANGGTVFIDEVGELPAPIQAKFLRVLERQEFTRVGGHVPVKVDVRVIAATHRDLRHEVDSGRFREDLYFRLAQVHVHLPPLRSRSEDIPLIAARIFDSSFPGRGLTLSPEAQVYLQAQPWPGNVRELRNVLLRAAALAAEDVVQRSDVAGEGFGFRGTRDERAPLDLAGTFAEAKERAVERFEAAYLSALMKRCQGNLSRASREADLARHYLRERLRKRGLYGLDWGEGEGGE
jgi:DNA-binding NtrC family response regulator